ncbi:MAG: deoxyribose-phosphate aldolase [Bacteroidetes bacterium GWF2_49_14]|nr:MAG: deoxyribose-phosphate aldolase [Bacteroidetes bacterium GWF2_49_14]
MNLLNDYLEEYGPGEDDRVVNFETQAHLASIEPGFYSAGNLERIFGLLDLTTLNSDDNDGTARQFTSHLNGFPQAFPDIKGVAAICIYPSLVEEVRKTLTAPGVKIAAVGAGFPSSQTFLSVKLAECELLVKKGADEIDVVISVGRFLAGEYRSVLNELVLIRETCTGVTLKVILETGLLKTAQNIRLASLIAMEAGADFIKTSTGKYAVSATPEAVYAMCGAIRDFRTHTGRAVGIKPAGGIVEVEDAVIYYSLIYKLLGEEWTNPGRFRIGASRLANNLLTRLKGQDIKYF